jgi:hypothetical protein
VKTINASFSAPGNGLEAVVGVGETLAYRLSGTFVGTAVLEEFVQGGWTPVATHSVADAGGVLGSEMVPRRFRWRCAARTSGTLVTRLLVLDGDIDVAISTVNHTAVNVRASRVAIIGRVAGGVKLGAGRFPGDKIQFIHAMKFGAVQPALIGDGVSIADPGSGVVSALLFTSDAVAAQASATWSGALWWVEGGLDTGLIL